MAKRMSPVSPDGLCIGIDCNRPVYIVGRGLCDSHYARWKRGLRGDDLLAPLQVVGVPPRDGLCCIKDCNREHKAKGYCHEHYTRWQRGLRGSALEIPLGELMGGKEVTRKCVVEGCGRPHNAHGLCVTHQQRLERGSPLGLGSITPHQIGAEYSPVPWKDKKGYLKVKHYPSRRNVMVHRVVMEEIIGRPLLQHETVHHINGVKDDNRPENLELWSRSQPSGQRVSDKLEWAKWFISQYEDQQIPMQ